MNIYKDNKENVIISLTKEENKIFVEALKTAVEELDLVKKGEAVTAIDREYAEKALNGLSVLHDVYTLNTEPTALDHMRSYLNSATQTENGTIYLKNDWENADTDEIIYISEYGLNDLTRKVEAGEVMTDKELVDEGVASTKNSIRANIKRYYPKATDEWIDKHDLVDTIIAECSWEYTSTKVDQMSEWDEIWDDYPKN